MRGRGGEWRGWRDREIEGGGRGRWGEERGRDWREGHENLINFSPSSSFFFSLVYLLIFGRNLEFSGFFDKGV